MRALRSFVSRISSRTRPNTHSRPHHLASICPHSCARTLHGTQPHKGNEARSPSARRCASSAAFMGHGQVPRRCTRSRRLSYALAGTRKCDLTRVVAPHLESRGTAPPALISTSIAHPTPSCRCRRQQDGCLASVAAPTPQFFRRLTSCPCPRPPSSRPRTRPSARRPRRHRRHRPCSCTWPRRSSSRSA